MSAPEFVCVILLIAFGAGILWARNEDRSDAHTLHQPGSGCPDCEETR